MLNLDNVFNTRRKVFFSRIICSLSIKKATNITLIARKKNTFKGVLVLHINGAK